MAGLGSQVEKEKVHPAMRFIVQREKIPFDQNALSISEGEKYRLSLYIKTKCPQTTLSKPKRCACIETIPSAAPRNSPLIVLFLRGNSTLTTKMTSRCK